MLSIAVILAVVASGLASPVVVFTDANFNASLPGYNLILVEFYVPWCGHCQRLQPEYEKAAEQLVFYNITLGKVNCQDSGSGICAQENVQGYPTIKLYGNGKFVEQYRGARTTDAIVAYMKGEAGVPGMKKQNSFRNVVWLPTCPAIPK